MPSHTFLDPPCSLNGSRLGGEDAVEVAYEAEGLGGKVPLALLERTGVWSWSSNSVTRSFSRSTSLDYISQARTFGCARLMMLPECRRKCSQIICPFITTLFASIQAVGARLIVVALGPVHTARVASSGDLMTLRSRGR